MSNRFRLIAAIITFATFISASIVLIWMSQDSDESILRPTTTAAVMILATDTPTATTTPSSTSTPPPTSGPLPASYTPTPTTTNTGTTSPSPTATITPSRTALATITATYTLTPTVTYSPTPTNTPTATPTHTPIVGAPTPVPELTSDYDLLNVLLLGNDTRPGHPSYRTDVIVVVSVNRTTGSVNMLSIPRDLYVYVPTQSYTRINAAVLLGETINWPGGGIELLKETIRYNLGIPIQYYALVNFDGFEAIVDAVGGVDVVVDCELSDSKLISPDLDPNLYASWEWFTLEAGVHHMDGALALWYGRSRVTTSDYDRNQRHQMLLRSIWYRFNEEDMWDQIPELWDAFTNTIETDLSLDEILSLVPLGIQLDPTSIRSYFISRDEVSPFTTSQGGNVLGLDPEAIREVVEQFYLPPTVFRLEHAGHFVEIHNRTGTAQMEYVAAEQLALEGFAVLIGNDVMTSALPRTLIYDYTGATKGSSLEDLQRILGIRAADIVVQPDPDRVVDYRVILGRNYESCRR